MPSDTPGPARTLRHTATDADIDIIHACLSAQTYWAQGISREVVARSIENSLPFLLFEGETLLAFARVVTDRATFAYLSDVFVRAPWRGQGLGKQLMDAIVAHGDLQGLRRFVLFTSDAHGLYARYGFAPFAHPQRGMERFDAGVYEQAAPGAAPPRDA